MKNYISYKVPKYEYVQTGETEIKKPRWWVNFLKKLFEDEWQEIVANNLGKEMDYIYAQKRNLVAERFLKEKYGMELIYESGVREWKDSDMPLRQEDLGWKLKPIKYPPK